MATVSRTRRLPGGRRLRDGAVIYWWVELIAILVFYLVYSAIRNANEGGKAQAYRHARQIIDWQSRLGIYHEETLQRWALHFKPLIISANYFYGSLHFVVTISAGIFLFRRYSDDYPRFRNTLAIMTAVALIGFISYPLMPPRLLHDMSPNYQFVDTLAKYPTIWSFNSGAASKISNQYAAMPSVHIGWASWCAAVFAPRVKHTWARVLAIGYPFFTLFVIVITANHYVLDALGGLAIFAIGYVGANIFTHAGRGPAIDPAIETV